MIHDDPQAKLESLEDLLEKERTALLCGDVDAVARLHDRKAGLIEAVNTMDGGRYADALASLNSKIVRNQALLDAAMAGIKAVSRRLATIKRIRTNLDTYSADGQRHSVELSSESSVERRA